MVKFNNAQLLLCQIAIRLRREEEREWERAFKEAGWWMEGGEG